MNRKQFISTLAGAAATTVVRAGNEIENMSSTNNASQQHKIRRGVSLYSYQQANMLNGMELEDMIQELSDIGAYGIEIMGQALVENYPFPSDRWIASWWDLMDKYSTQPLCLRTGVLKQQKNIPKHLDCSPTWASSRNIRVPTPRKNK